MGAYNYSLGNKDMARAGHNALLRDNSGRSFSGIDTQPFQNTKRTAIIPVFNLIL